MTWVGDRSGWLCVFVFVCVSTCSSFSVVCVVRCSASAGLQKYLVKDVLLICVLGFSTLGGHIQILST